MRRFRLILVVLALTFTTLAFAVPDCAVRKKAWLNYHTQHFQILTKGSDKSFKCVSPESNLAMSLLDLFDLKLTQNQDGFTPNFYRVVRQSVKTFDLAKPCSSKDMVAIANTANGVVQICKAFHESTRESRASTLVHEARHLQRDDPGHVACSKGPYKQNPKTTDLLECDEKFLDGHLGGSGYNTDIYFLSWILFSEKKNSLSIQLIKSEVREILPDRFNQITSEQTKYWRK